MYQVITQGDGAKVGASSEPQANAYLSKLTPLCVYNFAVAAENTAGKGLPETLSAYMVPQLPSAPARLSAVAKYAHQIDLTWTSPARVCGSSILYYRVEVLGNSSSYELLSNVNMLIVTPVGIFDTISTSAKISWLPLGELMWFRVAAVTRAGIGFFQVVSATPDVPNFVSCSVSLSNTRVAAISSAQVSFTLFSNLPADAKIAIFFRNFDISQVLLNSFEGLDGYLEISNRDVVSQRILMSRSGGTQIIALSTIRIAFDLLRNPSWEMTASEFLLAETRHTADNMTFDQSNASVHGSSVTAGTLLSPILYIQDVTTGVLTKVSVEFNLSDECHLPGNGGITFSAPFGFDLAQVSLDAVSLATSASFILFSGLVIISEVRRQTIILQRMNGTEIVAGTRVRLEFSNVRNPLHTGSFSGFIVHTTIGTNLGGKRIDTGLLQSIEVVAGSLVEAQVVPEDLVAFALTRFSVIFRVGSAGLPVNSSLFITFPVGVNFSLAALDLLEIDGYDYTSQYIARHSGWLESVGNQTLEVLFEGMNILHENSFNTASSPVSAANPPFYAFPNQKLGLKIRGIRNYFAGSSGTYQLRTVTNCRTLPSSSLETTWRGGALMERDLQVSSNILQPAPLRILRMSWSSYSLFQETNMTVRFRLSSRVEDSGDGAGILSIEFPRGFHFKNSPKIWRQSYASFDTGAHSQEMWQIISHNSNTCNVPGYMPFLNFARFGTDF
jgi:hypothetical protein